MVQDEQLTSLKGYINTGFPCDKKNLPTYIQEFWPQGNAIDQTRTHYLWVQNHSAKGVET